MISNKKLRKALTPLLSLALIAPLGLNTNLVANARARRHAPRRARVTRRRSYRRQRAVRRPRRVRYRTRFYGRRTRKIKRARRTVRRPRRTARMRRRTIRHRARKAPNFGGTRGNNEHIMSRGITSQLIIPKRLHLTRPQKRAIRHNDLAKGLTKTQRKGLIADGINNQAYLKTNAKALNKKDPREIKIPSTLDSVLEPSLVREIRENKPIKHIDPVQQAALKAYGIPVANHQRVLNTLGRYNRETISAKNSKPITKTDSVKGASVNNDQLSNVRFNGRLIGGIAFASKYIGHKSTGDAMFRSELNNASNTIMHSGTNRRTSDQPKVEQMDDKIINSYPAKQRKSLRTALSDYQSRYADQAVKGYQTDVAKNANQVPVNSNAGSAELQSAASQPSSKVATGKSSEMNSARYKALGKQEDMHSAQGSSEASSVSQKLGNGSASDAEFLKDFSTQASSDMSVMSKYASNSSLIDFDNHMASDITAMQSAINNIASADGVRGIKSASSAQTSAKTSNVSKASSKDASIASSALNKLSDINKKTDNSTNTKAKAVKRDAVSKMASGASKVQKTNIKANVASDINNTPGLTSAEKSDAVSYMDAHSDVIANPAIVRKAPKQDAKLLKKLDKIAGIPVASSRATSQKTSSAEASDIKKATQASTSNGTGSLADLNSSDLQALHDNYLELVNQARQQVNNENHDSRITDISDLSGKDLRVIYTANGDNSLFTKPEDTPGANELISADDLETPSTHNPDKAFMAFQTAKTSDGNTYYHVISLNGKHQGWISKSGLREMHLASKATADNNQSRIKQADKKGITY